MAAAPSYVRGSVSDVHDAVSDVVCKHAHSAQHPRPRAGGGALRNHTGDATHGLANCVGSSAMFVYTLQSDHDGDAAA